MYHLLKWESRSPYVFHDHAIAFLITCSVREFLLEMYHKNSNNIVHVNSDAYTSLLCWNTICLQTLNCNTCLTCICHSYILLLPHKPPPSSSPPIHPTHPNYYTSWLLKHHTPLLYLTSPGHPSFSTPTPSLPLSSSSCTNLLYFLTKLYTIPLSLSNPFYPSPLSLMSLTLTTLDSFLLSCHTTPTSPHVTHTFPLSFLWATPHQPPLMSLTVSSLLPLLSHYTITCSFPFITLHSFSSPTQAPFPSCHSHSSPYFLFSSPITPTSSHVTYNPIF